MTLRSCARTFIAGRTMSIIESLLVLWLWRLVARAKQSAPSGGNGRAESAGKQQPQKRGLIQNENKVAVPVQRTRNEN